MDSGIKSCKVHQLFPVWFFWNGESFINFKLRHFNGFEVQYVHLNLSCLLFRHCTNMMSEIQFYKFVMLVQKCYIYILLLTKSVIVRDIQLYKLAISSVSAKMLYLHTKNRKASCFNNVKILYEKILFDFWPKIVKIGISQSNRTQSI